MSARFGEDYSTGKDAAPMVGDYIVGPRIGQGSFAIVYKGQHKTPVAVKSVLRSKLTRKLLENLESEIAILKGIRHNHIVELVDCENLLLLPPPNATSQPGRTPMIGLPDLPTLKIADFGFARSLPSHSLAETLCGSPLYMAPEILRYERYDAKADLWSVGAVLYEMVTGRPPFRALNHVELLRKIEKSNNKIKFPGDPPSPLAYDSFDGHASPPPSTASPVSEDMKDVIRHLLKRNPVERISFEEFFLHRAVTAELGPSPHGSGAGAALPAQDDPLPLVLPQPTRTTSTPAMRRDYEPPPFAQQAPADARPTRRTAPILMQAQPVGFAAAQYDRMAPLPLPPLQQQGVVSRNAVGMQKENRWVGWGVGFGVSFAFASD
ncbi:kinase-like domain-containing protein, partial [Jimgerdemannia flammicorona]